MQLALKCADLWYVTAKSAPHRLWVSRLEQQMFLQGDQEQKLGCPVCHSCQCPTRLVDRACSAYTVYWYS